MLSTSISPRTIYTSPAQPTVTSSNIPLIITPSSAERDVKALTEHGGTYNPAISMTANLALAVRSGHFPTDREITFERVEFSLEGESLEALIPHHFNEDIEKKFWFSTNVTFNKCVFKSDKWFQIEFCRGEIHLEGHAAASASGKEAVIWLNGENTEAMVDSRAKAHINKRGAKVTAQSCSKVYLHVRGGIITRLDSFSEVHEVVDGAADVLMVNDAALDYYQTHQPRYFFSYAHQFTLRGEQKELFELAKSALRAGRDAKKALFFMKVACGAAYKPARDFIDGQFRSAELRICSLLDQDSIPEIKEFQNGINYLHITAELGYAQANEVIGRCFEFSLCRMLSANNKEQQARILAFQRCLCEGIS